MSYLLLISNQAPFNSITPRETIELGLSASNVELDVKILFMDQGIFQLSDALDDSFSEQKSITKQLSLLSMYDIEDLYAYSSDETIQTIGTKHEVTWINKCQVQELISSARQTVFL